MSRIQYGIGLEPRGDEYRSLVRTASLWCSTGLLVVRPRLGVSEPGLALVQDLAPYVTSRRDSQSWPGTTLLEGEANVVAFRLEPEVISRLTSAASRLYGWQQPQLPEDLCLLRHSGEPSLVTISHEGDGYLVVDEFEFGLLQRDAPGVTAALHKEERGSVSMGEDSASGGPTIDVERPDGQRIEIQVDPWPPTS